jgi:hypothetical protein
MDTVSGWDFTLANYDAVWGFMVQFGLLMLFLVIGNILRRTLPLCSFLTCACFASRAFLLFKIRSAALAEFVARVISAAAFLTILI